MSDYVLISWVLCLTTSILLITSILLDRSVLLKPSIIFLLFFHLMIQWAAAVDSARIETYLPNPWVFITLSQGFPLIGLIVSLGILRNSARKLWRRVDHPQFVRTTQRRRAILILGLYITLFVPYYLTQIPFTSTGLYTILTDPLASDLARESSLKLVSNPIITYGYAFMASVFAPLVSVLLLNELVEDFHHRRWIWSIFAVFGLTFVLISVSLTGARSYAAAILLTILLAWLYQRGLPINPFIAGLAVIVVLALPTMLTIWREGGTVSWSNFWTYLRGGIFWRVFYLPMQTGLWHVHYYQTHGPLGIQAIPRLAGFLGVQPINAPNIVALAYVESSFESVIANTSYIYAYYSYFGIWSLPFSLFGLWMLDCILLVYQKISDRLLIPLIASIALASLWFTSVEYTVVLLTNGFLILPIVAWIVDRLSKIRFRIGLPEERSAVHPSMDGIHQP